MLQPLMNLLSPCWKPFGHGGGDDSSSAAVGREGKDGLLWFRDIGKYGSGEFSMAVVQANQILEDQCQIESGPLGTFVGVYDGHGGPDAARYVCDHLFRNFQGFSDFLLCRVSSIRFFFVFVICVMIFTDLISRDRFQFFFCFFT